MIFIDDIGTIINHRHPEGPILASGARTALQSLRDDGVKCVLIASSTGAVTKQILNENGAWALFDLVYSPRPSGGR